MLAKTVAQNLTNVGSFFRACWEIRERGGGSEVTHEGTYTRSANSSVARQWENCTLDITISLLSFQVK